MFCKNCGKELDNTAKFCDNCGAPQEATPVAQPAPTQAVTPENYVPQSVPQGDTQGTSIPFNSGAPVPPQPPVKAKKSSNGCIIAIIIAVAVFVLAVIGVVAIAIFSYNTTKDVISNPEFTISEDLNISDYVDVAEDETDNSDYLNIFSSNNIIDSPALFIGLESRAFATILEDGSIDKMEFGYDGDTVEELIETIYYPLADVDDSLVDDLDKTMKETFADADALDCCTVTYETTADYYIIKIHSTEMDSATNLKALSDASVLVYDGFLTSLSMDKTADNLILDGYIER